MKKEIYYIPNIDILIMVWEDVICNSADTDVPFIEEVSVSEV